MYNFWIISLVDNFFPVMLPFVIAENESILGVSLSNMGTLFWNTQLSKPKLTSKKYDKHEYNLCITSLQAKPEYKHRSKTYI